MIAQGVELEESGNKGGRPTKYKPELCKDAYKLCLLGFTDKQLAEFFEVAESTLNLWKLEYPEFSESLKRGKDIADAEVIDSLFKRCVGYTHEEDKIFQYEGIPVIVPTTKHYPPDPLSCFYWLNNRQRGKWSNKVTPNDHDDEIPVIKVQIEAFDGRKTESHTPSD